MLAFSIFEGIKLTGVRAGSGMRQDREREQASSNRECNVTSSMGPLEERAREQYQCSLIF